MNFSGLIAQVSENTGMTKAEVKRVLEASITALSSNATAGEDSILQGFGQFKVKAVPARQGRNPTTGEIIDLPASRKVAFIPSKALKDALKA